MYHILFIYSIDGHLGYLHFFNSMNNTAVNICVQVFVRIHVVSFLGWLH